MGCIQRGEPPAALAGTWPVGENHSCRGWRGRSKFVWRQRDKATCHAPGTEISPWYINLAVGWGELLVHHGDLGTSTATTSPWAGAVQSIPLRSGDGGFGSNSSQEPINE